MKCWVKIKISASRRFALNRRGFESNSLTNRINRILLNRLPAPVEPGNRRHQVIETLIGFLVLDNLQFLHTAHFRFEGFWRHHLSDLGPLTFPQELPSGCMFEVLLGTAPMEKSRSERSNIRPLMRPPFRLIGNTVVFTFVSFIVLINKTY